MSVNSVLLEILMKSSENDSGTYFIYLNDAPYPLTSVSITHSPTPVNEPTTRGGVYFSDKFAYKMRGTLEDLSVIPMLTKNMLGPNTEFGDLVITTCVDSDGKSIPVKIAANLTNSVQTPKSIELSMIIVKLESD